MRTDFVQTTRAGLARLRAADPRFEHFGATAHRYELLPPATEAEVASFEAQHDILLPAAYRRFLLELGNGGAGPHYGLFPLGLWDGRGRGLEPWGAYGAGVLREPFPHSQHWNLPPDRLQPPPDLDDEAAEAWQDALYDAYYSIDRIQGAFPICHQGCAYRNLLIVSGQQRGKVWVDGRASDQGIAPEQDADGRTPDFEAWYLRWLHDALHEVGG